MSDGHAEGTIIAIQCPSCKTKFGVDAGVLGQVARPRFHCSKCDTTFSKSLASILSALSRVSGESRGVTVHRPELRDRVISPSYHRSAEQSPIVSTALSHSAASSVREPVKPPVEEATAANQKLSPQPLTQLRSSPTETTITERNESTVPGGEEKVPALQESEDSGTIISPLATAMKRAAIEETIFSRLQVPTHPSAASHSHSGYESASSASRDSQREGWWQRWWNPQSSVHRLAFALMPFIVIQLLIVGITRQVVWNPRSLRALHSGLVASARRMPPSEIEILNAQFRKQDLDNGESVYLVSGQVVNRTGRPFSQIQVQGLTFDELGQPLQKAIGAAGSSLTVARLNALSTKTISDLQAVSLRKDVRVGPKSEADFMVVLVPRDPRPSFFSARVFAVGAER